VRSRSWLRRVHRRRRGRGRYGSESLAEKAAGKAGKGNTYACALEAGCVEFIDENGGVRLRKPTRHKRLKMVGSDDVRFQKNATMGYNQRLSCTPYPLFIFNFHLI
jgi:hypothetical protein